MRFVLLSILLMSTLTGCYLSTNFDEPSNRPDASIIDAATTDAEVLDATVDAPLDASDDAEVLDADLPDADLPDADLPDADLPDADLPDADLPDAAPIAAPTVTGLSPAAGPISGGTTVTISGTGFTNASSVSFGGTAAAATFVSSTEITVVSPAGSAGTVDVTVTDVGGTSTVSSDDEFTYVAPPTVDGIAPTEGPTSGGTSVTISGTGFTDASSVSFGGTAATATFVSSTELTVVSPAGSAGTVDVTVTDIGGTSATSNADAFTYVAPPTVTSISPTFGPSAGGTTVTITGTGFSNLLSVNFGASAGASINVLDDTTLTVVSPAASLTGVVDVTVTNIGGTSTTSSSDEFTFFNPPTVDSVSPNGGPTSGGTAVTISGSGVTAATAVFFGSTPAASFDATSGSLIAVAPANIAGTVNITVIGPGGTSATSSADEFTYGVPPAITALSTNIGSSLGGAIITITGTDFTGATAVKFGTGDAATFTVVSDTEITATSPALVVGVVDITVTTRFGTSSPSSASAFDVGNLPTLASLDVTNGPNPGGTTVVITGTDFTGATAVRFGMVDATSFTIDSDTQITVTSPEYSGDVGAVDVTVTNAYGTSAASSAAEFTYEARPIIFVTSGIWNGNLGGYSGANAKCNADANKPSTGFATNYTYKALLNGNNATTSGVSYYRTDARRTSRPQPAAISLAHRA